MMVSRWQAGLQLYGEVTAVVYKCPPELPPFPPSVIGCIGSEHEQQRQRKTKKIMQIIDILQVIVCGDIQVVVLQVDDDGGINTYDDHQWKKRPKSIRFVKLEQYAKPLLGVVYAHL